GVEGSNPFCSTTLSASFRTFQRIGRNPRVCARFAIAHGPGEYLLRRYSPESSGTYPGAILLGPSGGVGPWPPPAHTAARRFRRTACLPADFAAPRSCGLRPGGPLGCAVAVGPGPKVRG